MGEFSVKQIGTVSVDKAGFYVKLLPEFIPALEGLEDYPYLQLLWWFDGCDNACSRAQLTERKPYKKGPEKLGVFATRSPERPNPIALSCVYVTAIDHKAGVIRLAYTDANDGTPVLDIKPYIPSLDRVAYPVMSGWCAHWPDCVEASGDFDWAGEFNF